MPQTKIKSSVRCLFDWNSLGWPVNFLLQRQKHFSENIKGGGFFPAQITVRYYGSHIAQVLSPLVPMQMIKPVFREGFYKHKWRWMLKAWWKTKPWLKASCWTQQRESTSDKVWPLVITGVMVLHTAPYTVQYNKKGRPMQMCTVPSPAAFLGRQMVSWRALCWVSDGYRGRRTETELTYSVRERNKWKIRYEETGVGVALGNLVVSGWIAERGSDGGCSVNGVG